jgi:GDP-L-fucose synthase
MVTLLDIQENRMKILVLGGTGFIGEKVYERLVRDGHTVSRTSKTLGLDLLNYDSFRAFLEKENPELIYNLASHGGSMMYVRKYAADVYSDNLQMNLNVYRAVLDFNSKIKIIQPFSNCSYPGDSSIQKEENWLDGGVHQSVFSFGNSKRAIYYLSQCYYNQYGVRTVNLLLPNTYGPGDSLDPTKTHALNGMVIRMLKAKQAGDKKFVVWGTGEPIREWAYVDDFVEVLIRAMDIDHLEYPVNVGQAKGYSIKESALLIQEACGFEGEMVFDTQYPDGDPVKILSTELFQKEFPNFSFFDHRDGIKNTVDFYIDNL